MLSPEENRLLTETGPGTPAGEVLRRYWQPVALSIELEGRRPVKAVRVLGEDLVLFRTGSGALGLVERQCAHRGADLAYARLEDEGLRCLYHGWLYGPGGGCLEQPAEPAHSRFHHKVRLRSYPCWEQNGIIFAYLGGGEPPPHPGLDGLEAPSAYTFAFKGLWECNWLQGLEGGIDPSHVSFLHRFLGDDPRDPYGQQFRDTVEGGEVPLSTVVREDPRPQISVESTCYGFRVIALRRVLGGRLHVRLTNLVFPNAFVVPLSRRQAFVQWHVPVDDSHHYWYMILYDFQTPLDQDRLRAQREAAYPPPDYRPLRRRDNQWGWDPDEQATITYTGMGLDINVHDQWAAESAGPIYDRSREHLGAQDVAILAYRRLLKKAMAQEAHGAAWSLKKRIGPPALDFIAQTDDWRTEWPERMRAMRGASPWAREWDLNLDADPGGGI